VKPCIGGLPLRQIIFLTKIPGDKPLKSGVFLQIAAETVRSRRYTCLKCSTSVFHMTETQQTAMANENYLETRGRTFYFRRRIPEELHRFFGGKAEIRFSLRTEQRAEAITSARKHAVRLDDEFRNYRKELARAYGDYSTATVTALSDEQVNALCDQFKAEALHGDEWYRRGGLSDSEYHDQAARRLDVKHDLSRALARGNTRIIAPALETYLHLHGLRIPTSTEAYDKLAYAFLQTLVDTTADQIARDEGQVVRTPVIDPANSVMPVTAQPATPKGQGFDEMVNDWVAENPGRPDKTVREVRSLMKMLFEHLDKTDPTSITKRDIKAFRDHLLTGEGKHPKTVDKKIALIRAVFGVAVDNEVLIANPASRIKIKNSAVKGKSRVEYDDSDIRRILGGPVYTQNYRWAAGGGEAQVWIVLLMLFGGMRPEEICQTLRKDVRCEQGIWHIEIRDS
jgi:hypothetical protein